LFYFVNKQFGAGHCRSHSAGGDRRTGGLPWSGLNTGGGAGSGRLSIGAGPGRASTAEHQLRASIVRGYGGGFGNGGGYGGGGGGGASSSGGGSGSSGSLSIIYILMFRVNP